MSNDEERSCVLIVQGTARHHVAVAQFSYTNRQMKLSLTIQVSHFDQEFCGCFNDIESLLYAYCCTPCAVGSALSQVDPECTLRLLLITYFTCMFDHFACVIMLGRRASCPISMGVLQLSCPCMLSQHWSDSSGVWGTR